ncbi:zinc finger protein 32-like [Anopheles ziemanni]|uniref:zinc finger protein 32-like n=1 Tax=Anopheles coustani TaxID=139045 RepID=UPI00265A0FC5|nr:zinc finger protein 32-like [Anopheles coustani]XP_058169157.1 zinc finger protein 32-like [Anopheles ziemanni]
MLPTCLSCHVKSNGMIAIYQHPNGLDEMFQSITAIVVEPNDHLCVPCYDDLKSAHKFKQRCIQNNVTRISRQAKTINDEHPTEHNASCSADVSTTCDVSLPMLEVSKAPNGQKPEEEVEQAVVDDPQQDQTKDRPKEHDLKGEHVEFIIDINVEPTEEEHLEPAEKDADFVLVHVASEEEENGDSSTSMLQDEEHEQTHNSQNEEQEEETEPTKPSTRLPRVHSMMCEFCFKEFESLPEKIDHTETHRTEQKPFKCFHNGCSSSFKDRVGLRSHVRIHATVKRFGCRYCLMRFHTRGNRNAHERTHNGEKPFVCPKCGKGFAEGGNLKNHIRFHTGERPYPCTMCDKSYRTHYSRAVHMRSHTNERPFLCHDCGKGFYSTGKLTIHQRIHTGERPYDCDSCDARFIDRCGLRRHKIKVH